MNRFAYHIFIERNDPNKAGERKLKLRVRIQVPEEKISFIVPTTVKVKDAYWDADRKRVKTADPLAKQKNYALSDLVNQVENTLLTIANRAATEPEFDPLNYLRTQTDYLGKPMIPVETVKDNTLDAVANLWLKDAESDQRVKETSPYRSILKEIAHFQEFLGKKLLIQDWDAEMLKTWVNYLTTETSLVNPSIQSKYTYLRSLLRFAERKGYPVSKDYVDFHFSPRTLQQDIALTQDELRRIIALDLSKNRRLDRVRDLFVMLCLTGLRYQDVFSISRERVKKDANQQFYLEIQMKKTARPVQIPLVSESVRLLEKHDYQFDRLSNTNFNLAIKEVGALAQMNETVKQGQYKGTELLEETYFRYELLSAHVGRRTWATLMYQQTRDFELIRTILGHSNIEQTRKYLRLTTTEVPPSVLAAWQNILGT